MTSTNQPQCEYVSQADVRAIASYARLRLSDAEIEPMTRDLNNIIESLKPITEYKLDGVQPTFHPIGGMENVMRPDIPEPEFSQETALENAPSKQGEFFLIPSILGESGTN